MEIFLIVPNLSNYQSCFCAHSAVRKGSPVQIPQYLVTRLRPWFDHHLIFNIIISKIQAACPWIETLHNSFTTKINTVYHQGAGEGERGEINQVPSPSQVKFVSIKNVERVQERRWTCFYVLLISCSAGLPAAWPRQQLGVLGPQMFGCSVDVQYAQPLRQMASRKIFLNFWKIYHPWAWQGRRLKLENNVIEYFIFHKRP